MPTPAKSETTPRAESAWSLDGCNACLISAACHLVMMIVLGLVAAAGGLGASEQMVIVPERGESSATSSTADMARADATVGSKATPDESTVLPGPERMFDPYAVAATDLAPLAAPVDISSLQPASGRDSELLTLGQIGVGHSTLASVGGKSGTGSANGYGGSSEFFGVNSYGRVFVYVVDCSGSMNESGKFERAKYELLHSIEQLSRDQKYFVIFYNRDAIPMDSNEPIAATQAHFAQTRAWVDLARPRGSTHPLPALILALSLKPDAIYFLSDGLFDSNTVPQVRVDNARRNTNHIPIHTIAFYSRENLALMRAIARDSGGEFRFVK